MAEIQSLKTIIRACSSNPDDHHLLSGPRPEATLQVNRQIFETESEETETDDDDSLQVNAFNSYKNNHRNNYRSYWKSRSYNKKQYDNKSDYDDSRYSFGYNRDRNPQKETSTNSCPRCNKLCGKNCEVIGLVVLVQSYLDHYGERIMDLDKFQKDLRTDKNAAIKRLNVLFKHVKLFELKLQRL